MIDAIQTAPPGSLIRAAGGFAIVSAITSTIGVVFLITMFVLFGMKRDSLAGTFGMLNDICIAIQYLLTIPVALALYRILLPYDAPWIRSATGIGVAAMLAVILLQLALVFRILSFQQQLPWVSLAMFLGVGSWLVITGLVARSTGRLPNSLLMSAVAVPYLGYPVWAFWLGRHLLAW